MRTFLTSCCAALILLCLDGCSTWHKHHSKSSAASAGTAEAAPAQATARPTPGLATAEPAAAPATAGSVEPPAIVESETDEPVATSETVESAAPAIAEPGAARATAKPVPVAATTRHAATPKAKAQAETLTAKVVLVGGGYRLKLADDESGKVFRLTRAKRNRDFAAEQINLRKYYEKTIVIRGKREDDWIWSAEIVGQWNKPGESRGPNLLAPPMPNR